MSGPSVTGNVTVQSGGALYMTNTTVGGSRSANGARALTVCGSTVNGSVNITNSSGYVLLGNGGCAPNTFRSSVTLTSNHGGFRVSGNAVSSSLQATNTTTASGALNPTGGPATHVIRANSVGGSLMCSGNAPAPTNEGSPNTVMGSKTGQCSGL